MKAYVLIETAAGKTKQVKKTLSKVKSVRASVSAMDAVTAGKGRFGAIFWVKPKAVAKTAKLLGAR